MVVSICVIDTRGFGDGLSLLQLDLVEYIGTSSSAWPGWLL